MNILLFSYRFFPDVGGIESISEMLAEEFVRQGHAVRVITYTAKPPSATRTCEYQILYKPSVGSIMKCIGWADTVLENNPCLTLSWPLLFFRKKHVIGLQTWLSRSDGARSSADKIKRLWLKKATHVIACSSVIKEDSYDKALVVGNPYDSHRFKDYHLPKTNDFVFLGRFVSDKGVDMAIEALSIVNKELSANYTLSLIGDGPELDNLQQRVQQLGLGDAVVFRGKMQGEVLVQELNKYKYLLVPSRWKEPFGIVALEGIAVGCWPIVADGGGLPDAIGDVGYVFKRNDISDLVAKMKMAVTNRLSLELIQHEVAEHLHQHQIEQIGKEYLNLLLS